MSESVGGPRLILEDGSVFRGKPLGADLPASGEIVFNTGMVGYPQSMTDPSYSGQILVFTYPLIGNYGIPKKTMEENIIKHFESGKIQVKGIILSDYSRDHNHWSAASSLHDWMLSEDIPGLSGIDTRALTKRLRSKGTMLAKIVNCSDVPFFDPNKENLIENVSVKEIETYENGKNKVVVLDCGCKNSIVRNLMRRGVTVLKVPWDYDITKLSYDGLVISNGPGDPKKATRAIDNIRTAMGNEKPIFGICLGNQLLALAAGGNTYKLKFGHRSQNQPCIRVGTKRCYITSQNHGFAVDFKSMPSGWKEFFINANDGTNEGIIHKSKPFFSVQFHPEASPGPVDTEFLFDSFIKAVRGQDD